ncbi:hypothetical protein HH214_01895 [Mucilaginibacter robiniae]|uniref:Sensor of ECF-type sigma factor n=1 Tax=Mucilaginibacter robiniae TaxID=2728022 RepID=A0A7L5DVG0_9SPHI|nr:hypothetical protein [Mucilaginibacter robiniae]QJD94711.1 hypothetical protein HH214_01895 [Mucilaginibacter robiniae]
MNWKHNNTSRIAPLIRQVLVFIFVCTSFEAFCQFGGPPASFRDNRMNRMERPNRSMAPARRIEAYKEGYMNLKLGMSPEQAQRFWPVYRQYEAEIRTTLMLKRQNNSNSQPNGREQLDREAYYDQKLVDIRRHYTEEFLRILPPQKVSLIYKSEREFKDELIRQLGERPDSGNPY